MAIKSEAEKLNGFTFWRSSLGYMWGLLVSLGASLGLAKPEHIREIEESIELDSLDSDFERELERRLTSKSKRIFILSEWGAGKTHQLFAFQRKHRDKEKFFYRSYFGVRNLEHAYIQTVPVFVRSVCSLLTISVLGWLLHRFGASFDLEKKFGASILAISVFVATFFVFSNRWKFTYLAVNFLWGLWAFLISMTRSKFRRRVIILDDLDRTSLDFRDVWALLADLWLPHHQYVIPLGYSDLNDRVRYLDAIKKLNGATISLPAKAKNKYLVACKYFEGIFPLDEIDYNLLNLWDLFTARDLVTMADYIITNLPYEMSVEKKGMAVVNVFYREIVRRTGISANVSRSARFEVSGSGTLLFQSHGGDSSEECHRFNIIRLPFFGSIKNEIKVAMVKAETLNSGFLQNLSQLDSPEFLRYLNGTKDSD